MPIRIITPEPQPEQVPELAVRTNPDKLALLEKAVEDYGVAVQQDDKLVGDVYQTAVEIRAHLPAGLEAGDFDGDDIALILDRLLASM